MTNILILGVSGQDGFFLSRHLNLGGYSVYGASRSANTNSKEYLYKHYFTDYTSNSISEIFKKCKPDIVINFAGESSVGKSFLKPIDSYNSIVDLNKAILEIILQYNKHIKYIFACSAEVFGLIEKREMANENSIHSPISPYGLAKSHSAMLCKHLRELNNLDINIIYLFNHESILRPKQFVTRKVVDCAKKIILKEIDCIELGNIDIIRDWGHADEYMYILKNLIDINFTNDLVLATGQSYLLRDFCKGVFNYFSLDFDEFFQQNKEWIRPNEITSNYADIANIRSYGFEPTVNFDNLIIKLCENDLFFN